MPNLDGTGRNGEGARTGRGLGNCKKEILVSEKGEQSEEEWYGDVFQCPNCKEDKLWRDFKYCPNCGREIEWIN